MATDGLAIELQKKGLKTKISSPSTDYLSCEILLNPQKTISWIVQSTMIQKLIKKFGNAIHHMSK